LTEITHAPHPLLRTVILINAVATLAAGLVLLAFPAPFRRWLASPSRRIRREPAPAKAGVAWLLGAAVLGAAEIGIAALCVGALSGWTNEPSRDRSDRAQGDSHSPSHDVLRLATTTLLVFHAATATSGWPSEPS
jgi:hypothetical protein